VIGKTISHYKIIEKLGAGGMGIVYKAQDLKLDRFVALKFLPPHLSADETEKQRFIQEAKAASALDHPNICTIYEIGESEENQLFIAMACYEGESLNTKINRGPLKLEEAIDIAGQIASGLERAHESDIVHRDIKPANIIITSRGEVKILDFGLAKLANQIRLTKTGTTLGTVAYMSPEQARGEDIDVRADIWSLGVILYEMVSGQLPFSGEYEQSVMYSIINEEPQPLTGLRTDVPPALERIVTKMLAKEPANRYQHADEILVDLKSLGRKTESRMSQQSLARSKLPGGKRKFLYGAMIFLVLLIIGGGIYFQWWREKESDEGIPAVESAETTSTSEWQNSIAVLPFDNISPDPEQEYFCDGMTEQIITNLSHLQGLKVIARTSVMRFKNTEKTIPEIAKEFDVAHILEGSVRKSGNHIRVTAQLIKAEDRSHLWAKDYDRKLKNVFAVQDDISEAIARALLQKLTIKEVEEIKTRPTENIAAYEFYLKRVVTGYV
jgi:non-specific serine/threonine protein kinase